ncbi:DHH phosphoesterase [Cylindrobasidium torrendii FP15055 ss-10]|uniref:DHH phosphoesterase n=1 Tax=Cylindrobasidium torrendii FP15055 ss-10 TaxID=1314674 RepID=A0A0D7BC66_9AGAR|nr:DHH phosphoesterase [Cylindrobasidium torrendii FP15055 ss-10]
MSRHLHRISSVFQQTPKPMTIASSSVLADFLTATKAQYLANVASGSADEYVMVMGNEAGDLDSVASAIAYSWITAQTQPSIPFIQIRRDDLVLRPENLYALGLAGVNSPQDQLLLPDDVPTISATKFALVDHNRLGPQFVSNKSVVQAIIDHHDDEQQHLSASPRIVAPAGSCAAHVAMLAPDSLPREIATLLLSAILVDTNGLKPGGKATKIDLDAVTRLLPMVEIVSTQALHEDVSIQSLSTKLSEEKLRLTHLTPRDHLRRDYKEYNLSLAWHTETPTILAGLSTVPLALKEWATDGKLLTEGTAYMEERGLTVLGVLTSFHQQKKKLEKRGKHKREMVWLVKPTYDGLANRLWAGLEAAKELQLEAHKKFALNGTEGTEVRVYKQGNANATRKATAPIMRNIIEAKL